MLASQKSLSDEKITTFGKKKQHHFGQIKKLRQKKVLPAQITSEINDSIHFSWKFLSTKPKISLRRNKYWL